MDYERKKRWVTYHSIKCKMYLRNDFNHECAYCRLREMDTGILNEEFFEKDHFIPVSAKIEDVDCYNNMIYACSKCNGTKSSKKEEVLLNPCRDDIYSGSDPHVINLGSSGDYEVAGNTPQGWQYITSLQLNSQFYRDMRKEQEQSAQNNKELTEIVESICDNKTIPEELLKRLKVFVNREYLTDKEQQENEAFRCGHTKAGMAFQTVLSILTGLNIPYELLYAENDIDIKLNYNERKYLCEIVLNENSMEPIKGIRIRKEQRKAWNELENGWGVLYYYLKTGRLEFYRPDKSGNIVWDCLKTE